VTSSAIKTGTPTTAATGTQAINRTLAVLDLFRDVHRDLGISEIAESLQLTASTVHRIVRALVNKGYLAQNAASERYYLGRSAVLLGQAANHGLGLHLVQPILDRLGEETGESVNLGARDGNEMVVVIHAESTQPLRFSQEPGSRLPVYATAMGKATLSQAPSIEEELLTLDEPLRPLTEKTITTVSKLRIELDLIRRRGYSVDDEEAIPGVRCVAAPILSPAGHPIAAVAVQGPAVRMTRTRLKGLGPVVRGAAAEIAPLIPHTHQL
jgi:IclR family acetate operon transcriptional repressor